MVADAHFRPQNVAALTLAGLPAAVAGYLRVKYGPTIWSDIVKLRQSLAVRKQITQLIADGTTVADVLESHAEKTPDKPFILFKDDSYSYADISRESNQMARFVHHSGVAGLRDSVAMLMHNEPAFLSLFYAFNKLGVASAFLNYNLKPQSLLHCITTCEAKAVVCGRGE